ncbi:Oidioi.mRNA.OKI2018_I69.PAR.g10126.t2.cds [Oikopleura dioica]|uniref:Oidioi.mRNA.OKI2018_I69.PAR.g10126.t2.cds n=1 Tax=Oikopleura dioica TaxID=34765 RepID=A0ABN7RWS0_OIKDI|nr:Oidioi.mRNA.OKI2018_I69.PAR.g10126.t2.cds [Oikopleura dioica]
MKRFKEKINGSDPNWSVIGIGTIGTSEFICGKCIKIVDDPVRTACCDSLLCRLCALSENNPFVCRYCYCIFTADEPLEYKEVSKFFLQILNSTVIQCSTDQCKASEKESSLLLMSIQEKFAYFRREVHLEYKCNGHKRCEQCREEYIVKNKHICVRTVRSVIEEIENDATVRLFF